MQTIKKAVRVEAIGDESLVERASIQQYRDVGSAHSSFTAAVYVADTGSGKTLHCEKATFGTQAQAQEFIAEQGYSGNVAIFTRAIREGNVYRSPVSLFSYGRTADRFYITQGANGYGRRTFASVADLSDFLDAHLYEWPERKAEILASIGESLLEDERYHLAKLDVFTLRAKAIEAGATPPIGATRAQLVDMLLCTNFPSRADEVKAAAEQAQAHQDQERAARLEPVVAAVRAGLQFPRLKIERSFWYLDSQARKVVRQDAVEHRRGIWELEERLKCEVVNLYSREDFEFVVSAVIPGSTATIEELSALRA